MNKLYLRCLMRLIALYFMGGFLTVSAATYSQTVSLKGKDLSFTKVLSAIRQQSGYEVTASRSVLKYAQPVTIDANKLPLDVFLSTVFDGQPLTFFIEGKTIVLTAKAPISNAERHSTLQQSLVRGQLFDQNGQPLAGATVSVVGMRGKTTATDDQGRFRLTELPANTTIAISAIGYAPLRLLITEEAIVLQNVAKGEESTFSLSGTPTMFSVRLKLEKLSVDEVVVTGLFTRSAESFTGAATTISGEELRKINTNSVFAGIAALDPAFRLMPNNAAGSDINQLPEIRMRGENSFPNLTGELSHNPNQPLFILDGFEVALQRIVDLDMNLIASITLLKDASATAIYGSRGANGVMVVATIPPKPGEVQVTFSNDFRLNAPDLSVYSMLNAAEKLDFEQRAGIYTSTNPLTQYSRDVLYNERYKNMLRGVDTEWLQLPTQTGYSNRSSLRLEGGDQSIRYGLQFTADLQQGVLKGQDRDNYSGQIDLTYNVQKFRFRNSLQILQNNANKSPYGSFSQYVGANPYHTPYDAEGNIQQLLEEVYHHPWYAPYTALNPLFNTTLHSVNQSEYSEVANNFSARYDMLPYLFLESNLGVNKQTNASDQFFSAQDSRFASVADVSRRGNYTAQNGKQFNYESVTTANLALSLGRHQIVSAIGFNAASNSNEFYRMVAEGFPYDRLDNLLFAAQYETNGRPTGDESTVRRIGLVYNGSYSFDNRFLFDLSARRDGSSQYGTDTRFGTFWSTGIGWNIHNEPFFAENSFINRFRLRANYGSTGSLNIPAYAAQFRYNFGVSSSYYDELGASLANLGNPALGWQNVLKFNVGLDLIMMQERLNMRLELYRDNTRDAITQVTLAPSTGFATFSENLGQLQNTGLEFSARYNVIHNPANAILWNVHINGFTNKNILKELSNKLRATNDELNEANNTQVVPNIQLQEGQSVNTIYAVRSMGVDPATGSEVFLTRDGHLSYVWNAADKVPVGISQPKWNGNFGSNLSVKGFELNLIFNYQFGGQIYNQTLINRVESVNPNSNVDRRAYELGWREPGDISQYTRISMSSQTTKLTSRFVQDERNLRLSSASVGYNFYRTELIKRLGVRSLQINASTNDLFWLSSVQIERGTDNPFARNYALSFRVGF